MQISDRKQKLDHVDLRDLVALSASDAANRFALYKPIRFALTDAAEHFPKLFYVDNVRVILEHRFLHVAHGQFQILFHRCFLLSPVMNRRLTDRCRY